MGRSDWEDRCKRHPEHRMSRGVCPFCLRDRLAHLSASSSSATTTTRASTSATTSYSSGPGGASSPPPHHLSLSAADASSVHVVGRGDSSSSFVDVAAFSQPLMPSAVTRNKKPTTAGQQDDSADPKGKHAHRKKGGGGGRKKKIGRFLSRLVGADKRRHQTTGDGGADLFHSKTMKEKTASKWVFF